MPTLDNNTRPDLLRVITLSDNATGRAVVKNINGVARLSVSKGYNEPTNEVAIESTYRRESGSYDKRANALLQISFANGENWSGTFDQLQKIIAGFHDVQRILDIDHTKIPAYLLEWLKAMTPTYTDNVLTEDIYNIDDLLEDEETTEHVLELLAGVKTLCDEQQCGYFRIIYQ